MNDQKAIDERNMRIAVIGGGVSGIVAAHLLQKMASVTIFDQNSYLGGHTNTIDVDDPDHPRLPVDTGFIVFNDQTYPHFRKFLAELEVPSLYSDMSFGYSERYSPVCYAGTDLSGLFARRANLVNLRFYRMLFEIGKFSKLALKAFTADSLESLTLSQFLEKSGSWSTEFKEHYLFPMGSAIWSCSFHEMLEFPAKTFVQFFKNHGLLSFKERPRWMIVKNGSQSYVKAFKQKFQGQIVLNQKIEKIVRTENKINIHVHQQNPLPFDRVVLATHADEALKLLDKPTKLESELLSPWRYQENRTLLHFDSSFLPKNRRSWASWNFVRESQQWDSRVTVTYHMNRLQNFKSHREYCVTLNSSIEPAREKLIKEINYHHPLYTLSAFKSQTRLDQLQGQLNTYFCGSYFGYGFHEDAVKSAVDMCRHWNIKW